MSLSIDAAMDAARALRDRADELAKKATTLDGIRTDKSYSATSEAWAIETVREWRARADQLRAFAARLIAEAG